MEKKWQKKEKGKRRFCLVIIALMLVCCFSTMASAENGGDNFDITVNALGAPSSFSLALTPDADVQLTWVKNVAADTTYIRRKPDSYPANRADGDFVYNFTTPAEPAAGAQLKSIQTVNFHLDQNVDTVKDMPINAVDLNKTYLICAGAKQNAGTETMWMWTWNVKILNDTTVRVYRSRGDYSTLDLTAHVVEFESGIKSVQRGDFTLNAGESSGILTINPIDTNKYFINNLGMRRGNDYLRYASNYDVRITLENSTAVKFERSGTTYQIITSYEIVEFE